MKWHLAVCLDTNATYFFKPYTPIYNDDGLGMFLMHDFTTNLYAIIPVYKLNGAEVLIIHVIMIISNNKRLYMVPGKLSLMYIVRIRKSPRFTYSNILKPPPSHHVLMSLYIYMTICETLKYQQLLNWILL